MRLNIIIPARGGSKGLKNKNTSLVDGIPLYRRSINHALSLKTLYPDIKIWVSTNIPEILNSSIKENEVYFHKRSEELSGDKVLTYDVILNIIETYLFKEDEMVLLFQPTTPFRYINEVIEGIEAVKSNGYFKSAVSLASVEGNHPFRMKRLSMNGETLDFVDQGFENMFPRQDLPMVYIRSGSFYISVVSDIKKAGNLLPKPCKGVSHKEKKYSINIDNEIDLIIANHLSRKIK